jgi:2-(1,2-epoxy-1,2-dihydrophenyl)acetyl-CoA isomerase
MIDRIEPAEGLRVEVDGAVLRVTLDRPERRNALTDDMIVSLIDLVESAGRDPEVRVIAIGATGEHFCSGFDLAGRRGKGPPPRTGDVQRRMRAGVNRLIPTLIETQTPIVVSARGWIAGLGLSVVLAADFAVVADDARLWAPFTGMGFSPDSGTSWLVPRLVGVARAKELLMLGRRISGETAADWGAIYRAVPEPSLDAEAEALIAELSAAATVAVGFSKVLIHRSMTTGLEAQMADEAASLELSIRTDDFKAAIRARRDGEDPTFTGR